ncbi:MAG: tetratricopeptide repeat protein [Candidatus Melainabacteria bacterium]|nr:tetratricopeptide repeat protein [Candidatus Melainabacteria bacterium]
MATAWLVVSPLLNQAAMARDTFSCAKEKGEYLFSRGDIDGAIAAFETACQLKPEAYEVHLNLVNMYFKKNQLARAIEVCKTLIQLKPGSKDAHVMLANLLRSKGDNKQAIEEFQQAMKLGARDSSIYSAIGFLYMNDGDLARAEQFLRKAAAEKEQPVDAFIGLAILDYKKKDFPSALIDLDCVLREKPASAEARKLRGEVLLELGRLDDAEVELKKSIAIMPALRSAHMALANVYFRKKDLAQAEAALRKVLELREEDAEMHYALGVILDRQGRPIEAAGQFELGAQTDRNPVSAERMRSHAAELRQQSIDLTTNKQYKSLLNLGGEPTPESVFGLQYDKLVK